MDALSLATKIGYELKNCRRGSYGIVGDTAEDLLATLKELATELDNTIENVENQLDI